MAPTFAQAAETKEEYSQSGNPLEAALLLQPTISLPAALGLFKDSREKARLNFSPAFNLDFVKRLLGLKEGGRLSRSTGRRLNGLQGHIAEIIEPRICYTVQKIAANEHGAVTLDSGPVLRSTKLAHTLKKAHSVVALAATVGEAVDEEIERMMDSGKMADAYVVDALGSGAVEQLVESFQNDVGDKLKTYGQDVGLRFSPGYCDWPVFEQKKLFSLLDGGSIGISLAETSLMHPRKSISAVFGVYDEEAAPCRENHNPCRLCAKKDCLARRTARQTPT